MNKEDGGPAFPDDGQQNYTGGMTLRDYFAAKAMLGIMTMISGGMHKVTAKNAPAEVAEQAYAQADAMIAARGK